MPNVTSEVDRAAVIAKILKLRALAQDAANRGSVHEAESAAARVDELLQRYRLDAASLPAQGDASEDMGDVVIDSGGYRVVSWRSCLALTLTRHYGCAVHHGWQRPADGGRDELTTIVSGLPSDVETVRHMYAWLTLEVERLAAQHARQYQPALYSTRRMQANAFRLGVVNGFSDVLKESRARATKKYRRDVGETAARSAAIVLLSQQDKLKEYMRAKHPGTSGTTRHTVSDGGAFAAGRRAGARIRAHSALPAGGRRLLGSGR